MRNSRLVICSPQIDYVESEGFNGVIPNPGAHDALEKVAQLIDRVGYIGANPLTGITVTRDSNRTVDISHPCFWVNSNGEQPSPFSFITHDDIANGRWLPRQKDIILAELGRKKIVEHCLSYTSTLEKKGRFPLTIYPGNRHDGTRGHDIFPEVISSLMHWEEEVFGCFDFLNHTSNNFVDQIGAVKPEFVLKADKSTEINYRFLQTIKDADVVGFCGLTLSHEVMYTINQLVYFMPKVFKGYRNFSKFYILRDATVPMMPFGGMNFPAIAEKWLLEIQKKGVKVINSDNFLKI